MERVSRRHAVRQVLIGLVGSGLAPAAFLPIVGPCPSPCGNTNHSVAGSFPRRILARSRSSRIIPQAPWLRGIYDNAYTLFKLLLQGLDQGVEFASRETIKALISNEAFTKALWETV